MDNAKRPSVRPAIHHGGPVPSWWVVLWVVALLLPGVSFAQTYTCEVWSSAWSVDAICPTGCARDVLTAEPAYDGVNGATCFGADPNAKLYDITASGLVSGTGSGSPSGSLSIDVFPTLTADQGAAIAGAILGCWALAWCLRMAVDMVRKS